MLEVYEKDETRSKQIDIVVSESVWKFCEHGLIFGIMRSRYSKIAILTILGERPTTKFGEKFIVYHTETISHDFN